MAAMSDASGWIENRAWLAAALTIGAALVLLWSLRMPVRPSGARRSNEAAGERSAGRPAGAGLEEPVPGVAVPGVAGVSELMADGVSSPLEILHTPVSVGERGAS